MTKNIYLLLFLIAPLAHAHGNNMPVNGSEYQLFEWEGKQGIKDAQGNVIIPAQYDGLGWSRGELMVIKNVVGYRSGQHWGLLNLNNEVVATARYTQLYPAGAGLLAAGIKGQFSKRDFLGIISVDGSEVLPFQYASIRIEGLRAIVSRKHGRKYLFGVVDLGNKILIPMQYQQIAPLGNLRFSVKNFEGKTAIFNDAGARIIDFVLDSIGEFHHGVAIVYNNHRRGLVDTNGNNVARAQQKAFKISADGIKALPFNTWAILDENHKIINQFEFDHLSAFGKGVMNAEANGLSWVIDSEGENLLRGQYDALRVENAGLIPFKKSGLWGVMRTDGTPLITAEFDSIRLGSTLIYAREKSARGLKWSVFERSGEKTFGYYDSLGEVKEGLQPVCRRGYWGYIDQKGEVIIHCIYDKVTPFAYGQAVVTYHDEQGIIDQSGDWVILPQKSKLEIIDSVYYLSRKDQLTSLKHLREGVIYFTENPVEVRGDYLLERLSDGGLWKIDFNGRIVTDSPADRYQEIRPPSEGFYAIKKDGKYGFIDAQNRLRIANRYDEVGPFSEGFAAIHLLGHWGFIDKREQIVVQPIYNSCSAFHNKLAIVQNDVGMGLIDCEGETACSFEYDTIRRLSNGRYLTRKDGRFGLLAKDGNLLINAKYEALEDLNNGFAIIKRFGKYGIVDLNGVDIVPVIYDQLYYDPLNNKYLAMKKSNWQDVRLP